jgi:hypothetical protein
MMDQIPNESPPSSPLRLAIHESHVWAMKKAAEASRGIDPLVILKVQAAFAKKIRDQRFEVPTIVITRAKSAEESEPWIDSQQQLTHTATRGKLVRAVGERPRHPAGATAVDHPGRSRASGD